VPLLLREIIDDSSLRHLSIHVHRLCLIHSSLCYPHYCSVTLSATDRARIEALRGTIPNPFDAEDDVADAGFASTATTPTITDRLINLVGLALALQITDLRNTIGRVPS